MPSRLSGHRTRLLKIYDRLHARFGPQHWWPADSPLEMIVGVVLTQNTAWTSVERAIANLKQAGVLSLAALGRIDEKQLARLIVPAGYYNVKARRLKNVVRFFAGRPGGLAGMFKIKTPRLREMLLGVNGLGPESADSILLYAAGRPVFVVDAYTKRVFARLGFFPVDTGYEEVQALFRDNLPHHAPMFNEYHALIVALAKHHCRTKPACVACPLGKKMCPQAGKT
jgi:endonuclease-3 related protein